MDAGTRSEPVAADADGFRGEDFSHIADLLLKYGTEGDSVSLRAVLSNNFNIILAALRRAGTAPSPATEAFQDMLAALKGALVIIDVVPRPEDMGEAVNAALDNRRAAVVTAIAKAASTPLARDGWREPDEELKNFLDGVVGVVEATGYEKLALWQEWHVADKRPWIQGRSGLSEQIGTVAGLPVCLSLLVDTVNGHRILFWEATSRVVDYEMARRWLDHVLPPTAKNRTDAMNFHNAFPRGGTLQPAPTPEGGENV